MNKVAMEDIPLELVLNWDQRGIKIVPSSDWTMEQQGAKRVGIAGKMISSRLQLFFGLLSQVISFLYKLFIKVRQDAVIHNIDSQQIGM